MITNEKQYKSTRLQIARFQEALAVLDYYGQSPLPAALLKAQRDALMSQLA